MDDQQKQRDINQDALDEIHGSEKLHQEAAEANKKLAQLASMTFSTEPGMAFLEWLEATYANQISFDADNPHKTSFNEGQRHVVLTIQQLMTQVEKGDL